MGDLVSALSDLANRLDKLENGPMDHAPYPQTAWRVCAALESMAALECMAALRTCSLQ